MCSLEEAFLEFSEPRAFPDDAERKRKKRRKNLLPPPEPQVIEPDRPGHRRLPPAELLGGPPTEYRDTPQSEILNAAETVDYFPAPSVDTKDPNVYNLEPDWTKVFNNSSAPEWIRERMPRKEAEVPLVPAPWMDGGATLWRNVPESQGGLDLRGAAKVADSRIDELQKKLDTMFEKMEAIDAGRNESNHLEIILFILGGLFLLLILDLLVKQGTHASYLIGGAMNMNPLSLGRIR